MISSDGREREVAAFSADEHDVALLAPVHLSVDTSRVATAIEDVRFSLEMLLIRADELVARKRYQRDRDVPELVDIGGES